jgi:hypothetical protein
MSDKKDDQITSEYFDIRFFLNRKSNLYFISLDDCESLINPDGKIVTNYSELIYKEITNERPIQKLSEQQREHISSKTQLLVASEKAGDSNTTVSYKGFKIPTVYLNPLKENRIVLLKAFRKKKSYRILQIDPYWVKTDLPFVLTFCESNLQVELRKRKQKTTRYSVFIDGVGLLKGVAALYVK